ncbi:IclR family transcriptional regulator [Phyllobacterium sp. K27]
MERARGTDRLLDVLDCILSQSQPLTRNAIASAIGAPRSTIYSIIEQLLEREFLEQFGPEGLILPGSKCGQLGFAYDRHNPFGRKARHVISKLAKLAGEVAELDVMRGWRQVVLISETGRDHNYRVPVEGSSSPLPRTASGRFLLQGVDVADMAANIPLADFIMADGNKVTAKKLADDISHAAAQGYWIARGLIDPYIACVTAPVHDRSQRCIGAVCLVVPLPELEPREPELVAMTRNAAEELSQLFLTWNGVLGQHPDDALRSTWR